MSEQKKESIIKNWVDKGFVQEPIDPKYPLELPTSSFIIECDDIEANFDEIKSAFNELFPDKQCCGFKCCNQRVDVIQKRINLFYQPKKIDIKDKYILKVESKLRDLQDEIDVLNEQLQFYKDKHDLEDEDQDEFDQIGKKKKSKPKYKKLV